MTRSINFFILFFLIAIATIFLKPTFDDVESGVYLNYIQSIWDDGDLNIVNQITKIGDISAKDYSLAKGGEKIIITPTDHYPAFWSYGGISYWLPFYFIGKLSSHLNLIHNDFLAINFYLALSTFFAGLFSIVITFKATSQIIPKTSKIISVFCVLGTPFFYYWILEPGNANLFNALYSALMIYLCYSIMNKPSNIQLLLFGLLLGVSYISKSDLLIYGFLIFPIIYSLYKEHLVSTADIFGKILIFLLGLVPMLCLSTINEFLKYGTLTFPYKGVISFNYNVLFDALFSSYAGHWFISPLFILSLLAPFVCLFDVKTKKSKLILITSLGIIILLKELIITNTYAHGEGNFGARMFCAEYPALTIICAYLCNKTRVLKPLLILPMGWTVLTMLIYWSAESHSELFIPYDISFSDYFIFLLEKYNYIILTIQNSTRSIHLFEDNFIIIIVLSAIVSYLITYMARSFFTTVFILYNFFTLSFCTILNLYNSKANSLDLKNRGFFKNAIVVNHEILYYYGENIESMNKRLVFLKLNNREEDFKELKHIKLKYHEAAQSILPGINLREYYPFAEKGYDPILYKYKLQLGIN